MARSLSPLLRSLTVAIFASTAAACGLALDPASAPAMNDGGASSPIEGDASAAYVADATFPDSDVVAAAEPTYMGSPLCFGSGMRGAVCNPDDSIVTASDAGAYADADADTDAGTTFLTCAAAADGGAIACRIAVSPNATAAPTCVASSGPSSDAGLCTDGTQCAAGFECVAPGLCSHYCCDTPCADPHEFCDIRPTAANESVNVPVCVAIRACGLLMSNQCATGETCAVISESGATSCVQIGTAGVGDSCETEHCKENLTCLGHPGARTCRKLCETAASNCASTETCTPSTPLLPNGIGICE